ncbi:Vesicle transport protein [Spironucleus salmonicida]|uniref:Vesicle transport protein n=1 Tax=Spironucleus salmonicida TaxID=348837 RepID=V6LWY6_9EUKA|nr:Vesicle transport protein [Spironucleus salmonicida]|eukprot:EST45319.1 Got1/Sft2-like family protein [Spironucleus salmonicida]
MIDAEMGVGLLDKIPNESICKCMPGWARYLCFVGFLILGFMFCSISIKYSSSNPIAFYILWATGVPLAWSCSMFVSTFKKQLERMKIIDNMISMIVILICYVLVIILEIFVKSMWANLIPFIICFCALIWYSLSLIPGFQKCCKNCITSCFSGMKK